MIWKDYIFRVEEISQERRREMFRIMTNYYDNISWDKFIIDLEEKDEVILLINKTDEVKGFTTVRIKEYVIEGEPIKIIFSGDTIVKRKYRNQFDLHKVWANFIFHLVFHEFSDFKVYWLLLTKGYKTYRFLPLYFKTFYPKYNSSIPEFEKSIIDHYGEENYPGTYDSQQGIIYNHDNSNYYLKDEEAEIPEKRKSDPHIRFFAQQNPGYTRGDELVCITELSRDNLRPGLLRLLSR